MSNRRSATDAAAVPSPILLFSQQFAIRWDDMDALEHVNNAHYLSYFTESRVAWAEQCGLRLQRDGVGMILAKASVSYRKPVEYPAQVVVNLYPGSIGRSSFTMITTLSLAGVSSCL
jgi:acyl-CoA thioester hydrolase